MGDSIAVSVQNVSKKFRLFGSPKDRLREALHPFKRKYHHEFWALKDISFEVPRGMTFGIVGRNGSGKSTLLQIICSVLRPSLGTATVNGRVSALLELGTGFNPEFTGRENVLLNGALMGFSRVEMEERLPAIEAFADIGEFFNQPVKIYSSGMFVRLAFAAAINVDPDILIVDEALAVGDAKFQHKCYQKFLEFQEAGKTIIFVTHDTNAIVRHCDCAMLLERGEIVEIGEPKSITNYYMDLLFTGEISGYANFPALVEEGYHGFNIVHYGMKYYAFSQSLGPIDLTRPYEKDLKEYMAEHECFAGTSLEEVRQLVNQIVLQCDDPSSQNIEILSVKKEKTELERFLEEIPGGDNSVNRKSYNKNEYRFKDGRAEIIDYLIAYGDDYDPVTVHSGDWIDIYSKVRFHKPVGQPIFSFGVRTVDGIIVYASNTWFGQVAVRAAEETEVIIFKFSLKLNLIGGDYFIGLDCSETVDGKIVHIDKRSGISHIKVQDKNIFGGIVELETVFQEVSRKTITEVLNDKVS